MNKIMQWFRRMDWALALIFGGYAQTTGALKRTKQGSSLQPIGYCCLGVAEEQSGDCQIDIGGQTKFWDCDRPHDWMVGGLTEKTVKRLGLRDTGPRFKTPLLIDGDQVTNLVEANDGKRLSFRRIGWEILKGNIETK